MDKLLDLRILLAEDDPIFRKVIAKALKSQGAIVEEASNGEEAYRLFKREPFNVIVSDIQMPTMSGTEFLTLVRQDDPSRPIFLLVSGESKTTPEEGVALGAQAFISKPFKFAYLVDTIQRAHAAI